MIDPFREGLALSHAGHAAMALLREAHARSLALDDARGLQASAAAIVLTSPTVGNFRDMAEMLNFVAAPKRPAPALPSPDDELLGRTALLIGQLYLDLDDPDIGQPDAPSDGSQS